MTYVAGDRVVTDLLCKPFSMGKNLLCVHSKKHMNDDPSQKSAKMKQNLNTVKAMQRLLKKGGLLIWIAPAGGRDRRDADGQITPGNWDPAAVEMMRKLGTKKGMTKTHYYPLGEFIFGYFWLFFGYFWLFFGYFWLFLVMFVRAIGLTLTSCFVYRVRTKPSARSSAGRRSPSTGRRRRGVARGSGRSPGGS